VYALDPDTRLQPNEKRIAYRVIDDEAILIDLQSGNYYTIVDVGSIIWQMIDAHWTLRDIGLAVSERYGVELESVGSEVETFVDALLDEGLIRISNETSARANPRQSEGLNPAYTTPTFTAHRDMAELLALDPPTPGGAQEFLWRDPGWKDTNGPTA